MDADPAAPYLGGHLPPDTIYGVRPDGDDERAGDAGEPGDPGDAGDRLETPGEPTPTDLSARLDRVEARVATLGDRLESLVDSVESTLRVAVAEEVGAVAGDLRRTVTELGRLLVRDLGRLMRILVEHRDTIVAELRSSASPAADTMPNRRGA